MVYTYLDVSNGNLPQDEFERMLEATTKGVIIGHEHEFGAWVYVNADEEGIAWMDGGEFPHLVEIIKLARDLSCRWVCFDADADFLDGFPSFEW